MATDLSRPEFYPSAKALTLNQPIHAKRKPHHPIKPTHITTKAHIRSLYVTIITTALITAALTYNLIHYYHGYYTARKEVSNWTSQMVDCLNGTWRGRTPSGAEIACWKAETLEQHQKPGNRKSM